MGFKKNSRVKGGSKRLGLSYSLLNPSKLGLWGEWRGHFCQFTFLRRRDGRPSHHSHLRPPFEELFFRLAQLYRARRCHGRKTNNPVATRSLKPGPPCSVTVAAKQNRKRKLPPVSLYLDVKTFFAVSLTDTAQVKSRRRWENGNKWICNHVDLIPNIPSLSPPSERKHFRSAAANATNVDKAEIHIIE